jgi:hypothetical protein
MTTAKFKPIPRETANRLIGFIDRRNLGKSTEIDGKTYTLDFISHNSNAFFKARGLSVYFRVGRSIVRISDHWAASVGNERSRKLNCGSISGKSWTMDGASERLPCFTYAGKYPFVMLAGICGLNSLNKTCGHFAA